jgi:hypothetical protein
MHMTASMGYPRKCQLWVTCRHHGLSTSCPVCPREQTSRRAEVVSAKGQRRTKRRLGFAITRSWPRHLKDWSSSTKASLSARKPAPFRMGALHRHEGFPDRPPPVEHPRRFAEFVLRQFRVSRPKQVLALSRLKHGFESVQLRPLILEEPQRAGPTPRPVAVGASGGWAAVSAGTGAIEG